MIQTQGGPRRSPLVCLVLVLLLILMANAQDDDDDDDDGCFLGEYWNGKRCVTYKFLGDRCERSRKKGRRCLPPAECIRGTCRLPQCPSLSDYALLFDESSRPSREPWEELSLEEQVWVRDFVRAEWSQEAGGGGDFVSVELEEPPKAATLQYLDEGAEPPPRYARLVQAYAKEGYLMEYRVGPLGFPLVRDTVRKDVTVEALSEPGELPYKLAFTDKTESQMERFLRSEMAKIEDFLLKAFGSAYKSDRKDAPNNIEWYGHIHGIDQNTPPGYMISWTRKDAAHSSSYNFPLPFQFYLDMKTGVNHPDGWTLRQVYYQDSYFDTFADFQRAWKQDKIMVVPLPDFDPQRQEWQSYQRRRTNDGNRGPNFRDAPPSNVEPVLRYRIVNDHWVEWMGWEFYVTNKQRTGLALYNVQFLQERIAYEMSLQEFHASYTGYAPHLANQAYFDSYFALGDFAESLRPGVDCPSGATVWRRSFCLWEHDTGRPLWRKDGYLRYGGVKSTQLMLRAFYTVGNYDYVVDVTFGLDGQVDMGFAASGNVFMGAYHPKEEPFGTRVHDQQYAPLHTHFAGFKVDLDVLGGRQNCLEKTSIGYAQRQDIPGMEDEPAEWNVPEESMYLTRRLVHNEDDSNVVWQVDAPAEYKIVSCHQRNRWGYRRGYEIVHPHTPIALYDAPRFPKSHMFVTQHHDQEYELTGRLDNMAMETPSVRVDSSVGTPRGSRRRRPPLLNGESLRQEDLVAWISLGFYHVPRAEDVPATNILQATFTLRPSNYFDENASMDLMQNAQNMPNAACSYDLLDQS